MGPNGRPHMVPLWFVANGLELSGWTYAKSQKAKNLERDPRATLGLEDGVEYQELRGVMFECDVTLEHDPEEVERFGVELFGRYARRPGPRCARWWQPRRRSGWATFAPSRVVTWDHRKLGGTY